MTGIVSFGAYIPLHRLSRAEIARAWGSGSAPGERAVAGYDEDSLTMGVAAALDCLKGVERSVVDGLYFATTTSPYKEKQCAATIAAVLGLTNSTVTMDFSGSLRCATNALKAAIDAVTSGTLQNVLVCTAETRLGYPSGPAESAFGDGAAAVLVGKSNTIAIFENYLSRFDEIQDIWRSDKDLFVRFAEDRFAVEQGYLASISECVIGLLKKHSITPRDISKVAIYSPNTRQLLTLLQKTGFDKSQASDALVTWVGDTGSAMSLMQLVELLEQAGEGQRLLMAGYGNGCDSFLIKVTQPAKNVPGRRGIGHNLKSKYLISNYEKYLKWRELVHTQPPARPPIESRQPSPAAQWREAQWELRLTGTRCTVCNTPQYPKQRVCINCRTKDQMEPYTFYDKPARVFSFSHDYVMQTVDPPVTVTMVDFEGGGRLMCDMTDRVPELVNVGMPLVMTFRKLYFVGGIHNYWWKCQPPR